MNLVPLSIKQQEKIISNLDPVIQENFERFNHLMLDDLYDENDKLISNDVKEKLIQVLDKELGIQKIYDNVILYRKLNLVIFNDSTFELLEATKSGSIIKFRDGRVPKGNEVEITEKEYSKINKELSKNKSQPKPPNSKMCRDALRKLSGGGG